MLDSRGDHGVPDGGGQWRLGRGQRPERLVVDAVVVVGEALTMSRLRMVASRPARASAANSLSLAAAILSRLLVPAFLGLLARMSPALGLSVTRISPMAPCPCPRRGVHAVRLHRPPNRTCWGEDSI